ncbi:septum site-determining protein MinD [Lentilactobacillus kefiri]|jgi:septum site-determining protein MinD|uniref:septum site-determining protein MinD n=1 Tax=Lentilactobacillus kefiri TaxID=33962 RepID=UPI000BA768A5|nr:septum site-determining protein MinD [Lentilactobacillus kefiri]MCJ2162300.1 septum site-determining protein MinD [Lentilactobacillus kefiri]MCP9369434.1 septum site-determining protein MinD [Lentilactobacillus kefiri]MDH5108896.1 septum site-determining protein MinD [Lentilactobacillus kefiri]MDM7493359.1 septum site-determining protein MinD [Lentilactobacillus kefiri]PAK59109.1 septum site-determining protein MinD [Lentilactobacillus kefiri]
MGKAYVITSGKGGVGKTTSSANIGTALAMMGKKVCLLDLDIGLRNLDVVLGLDNRIMYDIVDVANGRAKLSQALVKDKRFDDLLYLLPAAQNTDKTALNEDQVREIVDDLKPDFDFILIDCPAGIEQGFMNAIAGADSAIIVTTPEISAVRDADRVVGLLEQHPLQEQPHLIINRIRQHMMKDGSVMDVDEITHHLGVELLGIVFDDDAVITTSNNGEPVVLQAENPAGQGYRDIARRLVGESVPLMEIKDEEKLSFWQKIGHWFHKG